MHTREVERYSIKFVVFFCRGYDREVCGGKKICVLGRDHVQTLIERCDVCVCADAKNEAAIFDRVQNIYLG